MKTAILGVRICGAVLLLFLWRPAAGSPFYSFKLVAKTGQAAGGGGTFQSFKPTVSINDKGKVAFVGFWESGQGLFLCDGSGLSFLSSADYWPNRSFGSAWINNDDQVATTFLISGTPSLDPVRLYDSSGNY